MGQSFVPSLFPFRHSGCCKQLLARAPGLAVNFLRCLMPSDRHDLAITRSKLRKTGRTGLAQAVCRAMRQPCLVAPLAEPIAETVSRERLSKLGDEICVLS